MCFMRPFDAAQRAPDPKDYSHKKAPSGWLEALSLLVAAEDHISPSELVLPGNNSVAGLGSQTRLNGSRFPRRRAKMVGASSRRLLRSKTVLLPRARRNWKFSEPPLRSVLVEFPVRAPCQPAFEDQRQNAATQRVAA
jgi:hypothetical protein